MEKPPVNPQTNNMGPLLVKGLLYLGSLGLCLGAWFYSEKTLAEWHDFVRLLILSLPLLLIVGLDAVPSMIARKRLRHLKDLGRNGQITPAGYFRLTPYGNNPEDREQYRRGDGEHEKVFEWLVQGEERLCYLSGRSGTGKSSLLNAHVLPKLAGPPHFWKVLNLQAKGDPLASLTEALLEPGRVWADPPTAIKDLKLLLSRACGQARFPLLIVWDQFEEFLIHNDMENPKLAAFKAFICRMLEGGPRNLKMLLVFRTDYLHPLLEMRLPPLAAHVNWEEISPFLASDARAFLRGSDLGISHRLLEHLLHEIYEIEETKGLVRPITLNMIGRVLASSTKNDQRHLSYEHGMMAMMAENLRRTLQQGIIRRYASDILKPMLTEDGTKQVRGVAELAWETHIDPSIIRGTLVYLGNKGLVRRVNTVSEQWVIAHDFVAKQLDLILRKWKPHVFRLWRARIIFSGLLVWTIVLFGLLPAFQGAMHNRTIASIVRSGGEVSEDPDGFAVRFRTHPRLDHTANFMEELPSLYKLDLSSTSVTDLTALSRLPELRMLKLDGAVNADLKTLAELPGLKELSLVGMPLSEIVSLHKLQNLEALDLSGSKVEHFTGLGGFPHLKHLAMRDSGVRTVKVKQSNINFAELSLQELMRIEVTPDNVPYLTELKVIPWLRWLDLRGTLVRGLTPLRALPHLEGLELAYTRVEDLEPLADLHRLAYLDLHETKIIDLAPLGGLSELYHLRLSETKVRELRPLRELKKLKYLDVGRTDVADVTPLKELESMEHLDLSYTFVADISPLAGLTHLTKLDLSGSSVKNLSVLGNLAGMKSLNLAETDVGDLSPLMVMSELSELDISRTSVRDLQPLYGLRKLSTLTLSEGSVTLDDLKALRRVLPRLKLVFKNGQ